MSICGSTPLAQAVGALATASEEARLARAEAQENLCHGSRTHPERMSRGEQHWAAKLTEDDVRVIRHRLLEAQGRKGIRVELAKDFGVSPSTIGWIISGKHWAQALD